MTRAYSGENSYSVWSVLAQGLGSVRVLLQEMAYKAGDEVFFSELSPEEIGLNNLYTQLAFPVYEKLGVSVGLYLLLLWCSFHVSTWSFSSEHFPFLWLVTKKLTLVLGRARHPDVLSKARKAFDAHYASVMETPEGQPQTNLISPDLRTTIYSLCLRNGGAEVFQRLLTVSL
ncbi:unnamed protein product [Dibothriocephalus latus]|uniref:ERAP1-like C-terminal domain-containing protein n=1 Tax=Dibothriocephalus latus TaxID=60516 RepID=A0A3P7NII1_DIBLA|nr:unnamed protein product [Dibothriocephalus latus]